MVDYIVDWETRCNLDLTRVGAVKYINGPNFGPVCLGWKVKGTKTPKLWLPHHTRPPFLIRPEDRFMVWNAGFDWRVWQKVFGYWIPLDQVVDIMTLAARYTYPQELEKAAKALGVKMQKGKEGKKLMKAICAPPFKASKFQYQRFYRYCLNDVETTEQCLLALPAESLSAPEHEAWKRTMKINGRGVPIDVQSVAVINKKVKTYLAKKQELLPVKTNGRVERVTQLARIRKWMLDFYDIDTPSLDKQHINELLSDELPFRVREILELRKALGKSSVAKFQTMLELNYRGRIYDNLVHHRASTGRYGGRGVQLHNLPRDVSDAPDRDIRSFVDGLPSDPVGVAKSLIRSMVYADPLSVCDFGSIEYILLLWVAGETDHLQRYAQGIDPYKTLAAKIFHKLYEEVTKPERTIGKIGVLGSGYNLGYVGGIAYAKQYGLEVTMGEIRRIIDTYRASYPLVRQLWYRLRDCALRAVQRPGETYQYRGCIFRVVRDRNNEKWLKLTLPSGRALYYNKPYIREDTFGPGVCHYGIIKNHWVSSLKLIPGRITENIIQALARDLLEYALGLCDDEDLPVIVHVHDEIVVEDDCYEKLHYIMTQKPNWCLDLPLKAEGYVAERYRKD